MSIPQMALLLLTTTVGAPSLVCAQILDLSATSPAVKYRYSQATSRVTMENVPLMSALLTANKYSKRPVVVSEAAGSVLVTSHRRVSFSADDASPEHLINKMLEGTGVVVEVHPTRLALMLDSERDDPSPSVALGRFLIEHLLENKMPFHCDRMPAQWAVEMLAGFSQIPIEYPGVASDFLLNGPTVTIHSNSASLRHVLRQIADQLDYRVLIRDDRVVLARQSK